MITVHISRGDNGVIQREPEARARANRPHGARFRVRHSRERNELTGTSGERERKRGKKGEDNRK